MEVRPRSLASQRGPGMWVPPKPTFSCVAQAGLGTVLKGRLKLCFGFGTLLDLINICFALER